LESLNANGKIIFIQTLKKEVGIVRDVLIWLRIGTKGRKMLGIYLLRKYQFSMKTLLGGVC
jgi:hypothetical protein